jgi:sugar lactone lactonase YvrE
MRRFGGAAAFLFLAQSLTAQVITTIAGTSWNFPSRSLSPSDAPLGVIDGVAIDNRGNIFIADSSNFLILEIAPEGTLSVYAGNGWKGHSGDDGPAIRASIDPTDVAVDSKGNVYIQDQAYIRMVTPGGIISTIAGTGAFSYSGDGGPATSAAINARSGMITDLAGNLYFADTYNNRVRKISDGVITTIVGNGAGGYAGDGGKASAAQLNNPSGLAFDSFGDLYISDSLNHRVREVSTVGTISMVKGLTFNYPASLAIDAYGNLYIADSGASEVFRYSLKTAVLSPYAGTGTGGFSGDGGSAEQAKLNSPAGLALDASGDLYVADSGNYRLREVTTALKISTVAGNGSFRFAGDLGPAIDAQLGAPTGMAFDSGGNLYIADRDDNRIRKVTPRGIISTVVGNGLPAYTGDNTSALNASLHGPTDVALDSSGNLYIADAGNSVIRKVAMTTGTITTIAGGGKMSTDDISALSANLLGAVAVAVDANGNVYIADVHCNKVWTVRGGIISTFAGLPNSCRQGYDGDNGPAIGAALNSPGALAFDGSGDLYIADAGNNVVRRVSKGKISTVAGFRHATVSGPDGVPATSSGLIEPRAVALDDKGNLYVAELSGKIREVAGGIIHTIPNDGSPRVLVGRGSSTAVRIVKPEGVLVDGQGNVLIADTASRRIWKVIEDASPARPSPIQPTYPPNASWFSLFAQSNGGAKSIVIPRTEFSKQKLVEISKHLLRESRNAPAAKLDIFVDEADRTRYFATGKSTDGAFDWKTVAPECKKPFPMAEVLRIGATVVLRWRNIDLELESPVVIASSDASENPLVFSLLGGTAEIVYIDLRETPIPAYRLKFYIQTTVPITPESGRRLSSLMKQRFNLDRFSFTVSSNAWFPESLGYPVVNNLISQDLTTNAIPPSSTTMTCTYDGGKTSCSIGHP